MQDQEKYEIFVKYTETEKDKSWGEWLIWELDYAGYSVYTRKGFKGFKGFTPGSNVILVEEGLLHRVNWIVIVLSQEAWKDGSIQGAWSIASRRLNNANTPFKCIPIYIEEGLQGLQTGIAHLQPIEMFGIDNVEVARDQLLSSFDQLRDSLSVKPRGVRRLNVPPPPFPGGIATTAKALSEETISFLQVHEDRDTRSEIIITSPHTIDIKPPIPYTNQPHEVSSTTVLSSLILSPDPRPNQTISGDFDPNTVSHPNPSTSPKADTPAPIAALDIIIQPTRSQPDVPQTVDLFTSLPTTTASLPSLTIQPTRPQPVASQAIDLATSLPTTTASLPSLTIQPTRPQPVASQTVDLFTSLPTTAASLPSKGSMFATQSKHSVIFPATHGSIKRCACTTDGKYVALVNEDGETQLLCTDPIVNSLDIFPVGETTAIAWSHDGKLLAFAGRDGVIHIRDVQQQKNILKYEKHTEEVATIAWSYDHMHIASTCKHGLIRIWDASNANHQYKYEHLKGPEPSDQYSAIAIWSKDNLLASGTLNTMHIWSHPYSGLRREMPINGWIIALAWSPDGHKLAIALERTVLVCDEYGGKICHYGGHNEPPNGNIIIKALVWSPDGQRIASAGSDTLMHLWNASTGDCDRIYSDSNYILALAWGNTLLSVSISGEIRRWETV